MADDGESTGKGGAMWTERERRVFWCVSIATIVAFLLASPRGGALGMTAACSTMLGCGLAFRRPGEQWGIVMVGGLAAYFFLTFGYYWSIFPRGHGFFTPNRMSAALLFGALLVLPTIVEIIRLGRSPGDR